MVSNVLDVVILVTNGAVIFAFGVYVGAELNKGKE